MGYDNPLREVYVQPSSAFGATTEIQTYVGPKGLTGLVRDIDIDITADMVGTTTVPEIDVGSGSGLTEYARFRLGTTAVAGYTTAQGASRRATVVAGKRFGQDCAYQDYAGHVMLATARIPADTPFVITRKAGTGGVPAGTGRSRVIIDWS